MAQHVPLQQLDAAVAEGWSGKALIVVASGDTRSQQACTRLSQVFRCDSVLHLIT